MKSCKDRLHRVTSLSPIEPLATPTIYLKKETLPTRGRERAGPARFAFARSQTGTYGQRLCHLDVRQSMPPFSFWVSRLEVNVAVNVSQSL